MNKSKVDYTAIFNLAKKYVDKLKPLLVNILFYILNVL